MNLRHLWIALVLTLLGTAAVPATASAAEYTDLVWSTEPTVWKFQRRTVHAVLPRKPVGVVWIFHGTGGSSEVVTDPEMQFLLQVLLDRGYGFVAVSAAGRRWETASAAGSNGDWQHIDALRRRLIRDGRLDARTPTYLLGFSAGGAMVNYAGHVGVDAGWPIRALVLHNTAGRDQRHGNSLPRLPIAFVPSQHDDVVTPDVMRRAHDGHRANGHAAAWLYNAEEALVPTRFDRSRYINRRGSLRLYDTMIARGWFDRRGKRLHPDPKRLVDDVIGRYKEVKPIKPTRGILRTVLALHAIHAGRAYEEADFLDAHR